jgi:hypothetical protein
VTSIISRTSGRFGEVALELKPKCIIAARKSALKITPPKSGRLKHGYGERSWISNAATPVHGSHQRTLVLSRRRIALLDFDIATHSDLAAANGDG